MYPQYNEFCFLLKDRRKIINMTVLKAEDMMCDHCFDRIKNGLGDADIDAEVDLGSKTVMIPCRCAYSASRKLVVRDGSAVISTEL